jgi:hypothetical protein
MIKTATFLALILMIVTGCVSRLSGDAAGDTVITLWD